MFTPRNQLGVVRLLASAIAAGVVALVSAGASVPARAGQGSNVTIFLPITGLSRPPPPQGACKHLETVRAWQVTLEVAWSDSEGPTTRSPNGYPQTFNASAQQTVFASSVVPLSNELIYDPVSNAAVGRVFRHALVNGALPQGVVTGSNVFVAEESIYTPPDVAGTGERTVRFQYESNGPFADSSATSIGHARVTVLGEACKINLDLSSGSVRLAITTDGGITSDQPDRVGSFVLRQIELPPDGQVSGRAQVEPGENRSPGSPLEPAPPLLSLMAVRTQIRAWREGGPLRGAQVIWRLAPVSN
jgi:hypothetical protein